MLDVLPSGANIIKFNGEHKIFSVRNSLFLH